MGSSETEPSQGLTLIDHLTELRDRLVRSIFAIVVCTGICWFFKEQIFLFLSKPLADHLKDGSMVQTGIADFFVVYLKISFICGIALSCPFWLYQLWSFVAPGLYNHEKRYMLAFISTGTLLLFVGAAFAYYFVLPAGFHYFLNLQPHAETAKVQSMIDITGYLSFVATTALVFGVAFELPLVITLLGVIGVIDQAGLREKRRYAIMGMSIVAAIVTPPDAFSMLALLIPLCVLYEISIITVGLFGRKRSQPSA